MSETNVAVVDRREEVAASLGKVGASYTAAQLDVIKNTVAVGATDAELKLFIAVAQRTGLDPFTKQIHFVKRWDAKAKAEVGAFQIGIGGFRLISQRSNKDRGRIGPMWCGKDGEWKDVWLSDEHPVAARVGIRHADYDEPIWAVARWKACVQTTKDGGTTRMWDIRDAEQLAKCAEADARRVAFPQELSGLYAEDEADAMDMTVEPPTPPSKSRVTEEIKRDAKIRVVAEQSVAAVLDETNAGDEPSDEAAVRDDAPAGNDDDPRPAADKAEVLASGTLDDVIVTLGALRQASGGKRAFYETVTRQGKQPRVALVDGELLLAVGSIRDGAPVKAWLDNLKAAPKNWLALCDGIVKVAGDLNIEVVR